MNIFTLKKNDSMPSLAVTMQYANGSAIDFTGGSVFFNMANSDYTAYYSGLAQITGSTTGQVQYNWLGTTDTGSVGNYYGEFEFQIGGSKMTLPNDHSLKIVINEDYN